MAISSRSVLIAQQDTTLVNLQALMLKRAGCIIAKASNAQTFASALQQYVFDAVVYDVQIDPTFGVLRQHLALLRDANTVLIVTAYDETHVPLCTALGLPFATVAPAAVTQLKPAMEGLIAEAQGNRAAGSTSAARTRR